MKLFLGGKLRDAQMLQAELQEQLVPVERLKAQIRKAGSACLQRCGTEHDKRTAGLEFR